LENKSSTWLSNLTKAKILYYLIKIFAMEDCLEKESCLLPAVAYEKYIKNTSQLSSDFKHLLFVDNYSLW
jgi:hypothetical protein